MKAIKMKIIGMAILVVLAIFLMNNVSALGISPAKRSIPFTTEPQTFTYTIINNEHRALDLVINVTGELAPYIKISQERISMSEDESTKDFTVSVKLPSKEELQPGEKVGKIVIEEFIPQMRVGETFVTAKLQVISKIYVQVPYPEKYVEASLDIAPAEVGKPLNITLTVTNKGTKDINNLSASFDICEEEKKIKSLESKAEPLLRKETKEIVTEIETAELRQGLYSVAATIHYDENSLELGKDFKIGDVWIEILDYSKYFLVGTINKFDIHAQSQWNKKIRNAYAKINITNQSQVVSELQSISYDLEPYEKKVITAYWDTASVAIGSYNANMTLFYVNKSSSKLGEVKVISEKEWRKLFEKPLYKQPLFVIALAMAAAIIFLLLRLKKRSKGHKRL